MKKILFTFLFSLIICSSLYSQRILINENFETAGFNTDSLPTGWAEIHQLPPTNPRNVWGVRDSSAQFMGVNAGLHSRAYNSARSISVPWTAGNPIADDFIFTDSVRIQTGDSLIWWMLLGTPIASLTGGQQFTNYIDTMQVGYSLVQDPAIYVQLGPTIRSLDSNNIWTEHKINLSSLAGQVVYLTFRYYMNTSVDGLWCNIDNVFVGNRSAIGIQPISSNLPKSYALKQNYPNPFNPTTNINFDLPKSGFVNLIVFNSIGQEVATLVNQDMKAGSYKVDWNAQNMPSGAYYYRITAGTFTKTNKMILVK